MRSQQEPGARRQYTHARCLPHLYGDPIVIEPDRRVMLAVHEHSRNVHPVAGSNSVSPEEHVLLKYSMNFLCFTCSRHGPSKWSLRDAEDMEWFFRCARPCPVAARNRSRIRVPYSYWPRDRRSGPAARASRQDGRCRQIGCIRALRHARALPTIVSLHSNANSIQEVRGVGEIRTNAREDSRRGSVSGRSCAHAGGRVQSAGTEAGHFPI